MADTDDQPQDSAEAKADAIALAEQAEAEAAEAEALAAAARARARAIKLRREAEAQTQEPTAAETQEPIEPPEAPEKSTEPQAESTAPVRSWWPTLSTLLFAAAIIGICALLGVSGWMLWHHHDVVQQRQRSAAYIAAARQGVVNLTSLDFNKAKEDVQRVLDSATGEFKDDFQRRADDFASVVKDSKAVTEGSVVASAVESMGKDSAVVLLVANERVTNVAGAKDEPRTFRFRVSVAKDGDQLKISKLEFVL